MKSEKIKISINNDLYLRISLISELTDISLSNIIRASFWSEIGDKPGEIRPTGLKENFKTITLRSSSSFKRLVESKSNTHETTTSNYLRWCLVKNFGDFDFKELNEIYDSFN